MFNLTLEEKRVLIFLTLCILLGLGVNFYRKLNPASRTVLSKETILNKQLKKNPLININTATEEEFRNLPGVGEVIARRIVEYRSKRVKFKDIQELKKVEGIGQKKFKKIEGLIVLE